MKNIISSIVVLVCLVIAGLMALPFVVSSQNIKQQLAQRIQELTASKISYQGEPVLTFSPYLGVELLNVVIAGTKPDDQNIDWLRIEKLQFELKIIPLLLGRTRFSKFRMIRPRISLPIQEHTAAGLNKSLEKQQNALSDTNKLNAGDSISDIRLGQFEIIDGIVETASQGTGSTYRLSNLHAVMDWPSLASSWKITGQGIWRGEAFEFSNEVEKPLVFFTSGKSGLSVEFDSPALTASFNGQATMLSDVQLLGDASISTPSIPRLYELLFEYLPAEIPSLGNFLVKGKVSANIHEIQFDESIVELGTNQATGNLVARRSKHAKPKISGTLAFKSLDVTPFFELFSGKQSANDNSNTSLADVNPFDYDIRFSAQDYRFQENSFGTLAATIMLTKKQWAIDIGEADFFDGMITGTISSGFVKTAREIVLKGNLHDVSMGKITTELYGGEFVTTGIADVKFSLKAPGDAYLGSFREYFGSMKVTLTNGQIDGVDLVKAIPALIKNNGFVTIDEIKGETPFNNLALDMLIYNGVGWITKGNATSDKNEFRISGKADLVRGSLAIYTNISQKASAEKPLQQARIFIGGTVKNPLVTQSPLSNLRPQEPIQ
ncbi:MAG: AsmA family protein [Hyphomicrobiales bacterium]|nr:AsmA family protein [Hyphomicrobiales bacterium]